MYKYENRKYKVVYNVVLIIQTVTNIIQVIINYTRSNIYREARTVSYCYLHNHGHIMIIHIFGNMNKYVMCGQLYSSTIFSIWS